MTSMCWKGRNRLKIGTCLAINSTAGGLLTEGIGFEEKRIVGQIVLLCAFAFEIRGYSGRMRHCGGIFYNRRTEGARGKWKAHCKCRYRQCYYKNPFNGGMTRRLRRGSGTYRPKGHSHFSFDGERKVCKRKPVARRLREKSFSFGGGARNVVRNGVGQLIHKGGAHSCSPFSAAKMGGPFSLRCLTPLCSLAVDTGRTQIAVLGSYSAAWRLRSAEKQTLFFSFTVGARHA